MMRIKKAISINELREKMGMGDIRYNQPKEAPQASEERVERTILATEIYRQARLAIVRDQILSPEVRSAILQVQDRQVAYGIDKYPEPLNANTWTVSETVYHILDESIDKLHYLVMLRIKLEQDLISGAYNDVVGVRMATSRVSNISRMIDNTIEDMNYLICLEMDYTRENEARPNDSMDAMAYGVKFAKSECLAQLSGADYDGDKSMIYADDKPYGVVDDGTLRVFSDDELKALAEGKNEVSTRWDKEWEAKAVKAMSQHKCCCDEE